MKATVSLLFAILSIGLAGCADNSGTNPGGPSIRVSGTVMACNCISFCSLNTPFTAMTGKQAKVVFKRNDGLTFSTMTDDSSRVSLLVDTGTYQILTESYYQPLFPTRFDFQITGDTTGIRIGTELTYDPPDSLNARFRYPTASPAWTEAEERQSLDYLNGQLGGILDFRNVVRTTVVYGDTLYVEYRQIGVEEMQPAWKAESEADSIAAHRPDKFPPGFITYGYFHICPD